MVYDQQQNLHVTLEEDGTAEYGMKYVQSVALTPYLLPWTRRPSFILIDIIDFIHIRLLGPFTS